MAQTPDGVRHIECKDDSNRLLFVRFLEIQLASGSEWKIQRSQRQENKGGS
jgi:hypothetical protein